MKLGSEQHKELFCRSFIDSHLKYEPEQLPWPELDGLALERLQAIPFWKEALYTERKAGEMVSAFAKTISDPAIQDAIALQGREESRHARLIQFLIDRYQIQIPELPAIEIPQNINTAFKDFGFEECLDSFFAFGLFDIARQSKYFPEALLAIFDPILDEEARHIVFFVNWFTYEQINRGWGFNGLRSISTLGHYKNALWGLIKTFGGSEEDKQKGFTATGASTFMDDLTAKLFFSTCLEANTRRMKVFEPELLRPQLIPTLSKVAFNCLKLLPGL
jgi:hypothetical protein